MTEAEITEQANLARKEIEQAITAAIDPEKPKIESKRLAMSACHRICEIHYATEPMKPKE